MDVDSTPDDKLGYTMTCVKAIEGNRWSTVHKCLRAYPELKAWIQENNYSISATNLHNIKQHALYLARDQIRIDIHALDDVPEEEVPSAKESILKKLKRMTPGPGSGIGAMQREDGSICTSPEEIALVLRKHWQGVFKRKEVNTAAVQIWMEELFIKDEQGFITLLPPKSCNSWKISHDRVRTAINSAKNSMPGPDGIPAAAWKALGDAAVDVFYCSAMALCSSGFKTALLEAYADRCMTGTHAFNLSLLCCLPKKPYGTDPEVGEFYRGEDTRPLALVNTDNRIIANAARLTWEPLLNKYISKAQRGFLKGRHMINNLIEIDYDAMRISMRAEKGMLVLFDFKAAFPSVSHDFLMSSLEAIGLPPHAIHFINALYDNNKCNISYQGNLYDGFGMECGVRQGCPISPLLFAAAVDILLRRLANKVGDSTIKAFADDIGAVFADWDRDSPVAEEIFREFAEMSGLELNTSKTICIPLWEENIDSIRQTMKDSQSLWKDVQVDTHGTYLGVAIGPGSPGISWEKPLKK